jgi:FkbM family methyltransferase
MRIAPDLPPRERIVRLEPDVEIEYRLDRGDIQTIREVWIDEIYRLPFDLRPSTVLDLGAHIGLSSLWLHRTYGFDHAIAVEPLAANAQLARRNLLSNDVPAEVVLAAVGCADGIALFASGAESNQGHLAQTGSPVPVMTVDALLDRLTPKGTVDLLKIDIEAAEQMLFCGDLHWLRRVRAMIVEFHPAVFAPALSTYEEILRRIEGAGFQYFAPGSVPGSRSDAFLRAGDR